MEIGEIWISIILPIIIGPLFVFFKTIWDRTCDLKQKKKQLLFDDTRNRLKHQLDEFYYPVYLKLLLLYSLSYILPEPKNETEFASDYRQSESSSESEFCSSDEEYVLSSTNEASRDKKSIKYKKRRCMAYYKMDNEYINCRNIIPHNGFSKVCKCCRWKFLAGKIEINILDENEINPNSVFYSPRQDDIITNSNEKSSSSIRSVSSKLDTVKKRTKRNNQKNSIKVDGINDITIQIPEFIDISDLDATNHNKSIIEHMNMQTISISEKTIPIIECACHKYYSEIAKSIEEKIHIIEPNTRLTKHLIRFLKYAKIRDLIHDNNLCDSDCKTENFGAKNNIDILLGHIEANLNKYGNQYKTLMEKGII